MRFDPSTDQLQGRVVVRARSTQALSRFDLDLRKLVVDSVTVAGRAAARVARTPGEIVITPARPVRDHTRFRVVVRYHGNPGNQPRVGNGWFDTRADCSGSSTCSMGAFSPPIIRGTSSAQQTSAVRPLTMGFCRISWAWPKSTVARRMSWPAETMVEPRPFNARSIVFSEAMFLAALNEGRLFHETGLSARLQHHGAIRYSETLYS